MEIFEGPYFKYNKRLLTAIGLWPYGTKLRYVVRASFMIGTTFLTMPHVVSAIIHRDNVDRLMLNCLTFLVMAVIVLKMVGISASESKVRKLFESIANNWEAIQDEEERKILIQYTERSRLINIFYMISIANCGVVICIVSSLSKILDKIIPLEKPRPILYLMEGEFFVDRQKYFIELFIWDSLVVFLTVITTITVDTVYIAATEHCCALNAIISHRSRNLGKKLLGVSSNTDVDSYNAMINIIKLHQIALSFTATINDSFSYNFLFIMTVNLVVIPLNACAILANLGSIGVTPYAMLFFAIMIHFFVVFFPGQRVLDHNLTLCDDVCNNEWFTLPPRTKKLLLMYMLRCSEPASLSAGGLFLVTFEVYAKVLRTSVSYIAVLASFR